MLGSSFFKTSVAPLSFPPSIHSRHEVNYFDLAICECLDLCLEKQAMKGRPPGAEGFGLLKAASWG